MALETAAAISWFILPSGWLAIITAATVALAGFAAAFAWGVYKRYGILAGGFWMPLAFTLLLVQRISVLGIDLQVLPYDTLRVFNAITFFLFSACLLYGLWRVKKESDEFVKSDKQVMKAIGEFEKRRARAAKKQ